MWEAGVTLMVLGLVVAGGIAAAVVFIAFRALTASSYYCIKCHRRRPMRKWVCKCGCMAWSRKEDL